MAYTDIWVNLTNKLHCITIWMEGDNLEVVKTWDLMKNLKNFHFQMIRENVYEILSRCKYKYLFNKRYNVDATTGKRFFTKDDSIKFEP